jgi:hypothetical protein
MARKIGSVQPSATPSAPPSSGADDLTVLDPHITLPLSGRTVLVREYGLTEGLRVRAYMRPFTADLEKLFKEGGDALVEDILDLVAVHQDIVCRAIAQSIADEGTEASTEDVAAVAGLADRDGDLLLNVWWGVCGLFFVRQILRRAGERARRAALVGATSSTPSSAPATERPTGSAGTPSDSSSSSATD